MGDNDIRGLVENQSGACRALAMALQSYGESMGMFRRQEAKIILGFAESARAIADGLTEAALENTPGRLKALWAWSGHIAVPFVLGATIAGGAQGYAAAIAGSWGDNPTVVECAVKVMDGADRGFEEINDWKGNPQQSAEANYPSPAAEYFGLVLKRGHFGNHDEWPEAVEAFTGNTLKHWQMGLAEDPPGSESVGLVDLLERLNSDRTEGQQAEDTDLLRLLRRVVEASAAGTFRLEDFPKRSAHG